MAKDMTTFPVAKKGAEDKSFGYADATQIAKSNGKLVLFDATAADKVKVEAKVEAEKARQADEEAKKTAAAAAGGADSKAVKKAPAAK